MAKDKEEVVEVEETNFTDRILKLVQKDYGKGLAVSSEQFLTNRPRVIPISPTFNVALGGGVPEGSWFLLTGKQKCGKTTTALHFAAKCQQPKYGSKHIYYLNIEGRLKEMNLRGIDGLKPEQFTIISSHEDKILSAQDYLNIAEKILMTHKECVLLVDSFSMLCHEKEILEGVGTSTRGGGALLLSQFCRQMAGVVPVKRSIVIGIMQLMANTSGYGAATQEKGGNSIQYQGDVKVRCKNTEEWEDEGKRIGQKVNWVLEYSALGTPPGQEFTSYLRYNHGIDEVKEIITLGTDIGLINKAGAWYTCDFMQTRLPLIGATAWDAGAQKKCKAQGENNLYHLIKNNPGWLEYLEQDMFAMLGIKS